jgi:hypothetical protein
MARLTEADMQMRGDGYVTAREVADAVGRNLTSIQRAVTDGRVRGKKVGSESYQRYYVDIHALVASGVYAGAPTASAKLAALAEGVPRARAEGDEARVRRTATDVVAGRRRRAAAAKKRAPRARAAGA